MNVLAHTTGPLSALAGDGGALTLAFIQFNRPAWWLIFIPIALALVWIGRKSLSGMSSRTRRVALGIRLAVAGLIIGALAEPQLRRVAKDVAVTLIVDASRSQPKDILARSERLVRTSAQGAQDGDLLGLITVARDAGIQKVPSLVRETNMDAPSLIATDATDLAAGVRAAMSVMPPGAANRLVLVSDGNETAGDLMEAARAATAAKVPIDVVPVRYSIDREVMVDRLIAPATARPGEIASVRVVMTATRPTSGRLSLFMNGQPVDLDSESASMGMPIDLDAGTNVRPVPIRLPASGPVKFQAIFEPEGAPSGAGGATTVVGGGPGSRPDAGGDTLSENNQAIAVTFIGGQGRILVLTSRTEEAAPLVQALGATSRAIQTRNPSEGWADLAELGAFECVVMVNAAAFEFTEQQQRELKSYVHDLGGGLVMVGGDQSFGAGGWIGSTLAEALPIKLDPPQKRQMPRGALALVMHSCEIPDGNTWGRKTAEAAIRVLQAQDLAGVIEYDWRAGGGGGAWVHPLSVLGDKSAALRSLQGLTYGDAPDFHDMLQKAYDSLVQAQAGQKHVIVISDGDPSRPSDGLLAKYVGAKISISTVAVYPHGGVGDLRKMESIAKRTGGNYYEITKAGQLNALPEIFIKEAQTVKRSLIWEGDPVQLQQASVTDGMRGISRVPAISGYIVAADREGLSQIVLRGPENDPVLAQWQHGLGRVVTFTSDAGPKWASRWASWEQYRQFWDQHAKWAMRPATNPNVRVVTQDKGEKTQVIVEAADQGGERMNFLQFQARMVAPDGSARAFDLVQTGPGRYEATVDTAAAGAYTLNMGYQAPGAPATPTSEPTASTRGAVQVAITRPFADEFRALRDNAALLENVAKRTGGRVLAFDDTTRLWERQGLDMPVSLRPVWLAVLLGAVGLFLLDVAVRRVRIDVPAIGRRVGRLFGRAKDATTTQMDQLAAAREKARQRIDERQKATGGGVGESVAYDAGALTQAAASKRKFEVSDAELAAAAKQNASGGGAIEGLTPGQTAAPVVTKKAAGEEKPGESGISRLKKAKQRAQDELKD